MNQLMGSLPDYQCEHLDAAQLEVSVVELKYPPVPRFGDERFLAGIKEALSTEYPLVETAPVMSLVLSPQGISQSASGTMLRFTSIDRRWIVGLGEASVTLETRQYTDIDEFSERFTEILTEVDAHLRPKHQLRFGLRYVNEFRNPAWTTYDDFRRLLNPLLLGWAARDILGGAVEQTLGEVRARREDGVVLVRHGFLQGTTVTPMPANPPKVGPFYLLDLDYYDEAPHKFDIDTPGELMHRHNAFLYRVFRWAVGESELYHRLRGHQ